MQRLLAADQFQHLSGHSEDKKQHTALDVRPAGPGGPPQVPGRAPHPRTQQHGQRRVTRRRGTGSEHSGGAAAGPESMEAPRRFPAQSRATGQEGDALRTHDWAVTRRGRKDVSDGQEGDRLHPFLPDRSRLRLCCG